MISVIIPAFNAGSTIKKTLNSILDQSYQNFEIIIIDDGSTDNTSELCIEFSKNDQRFSLYKIENSGPSNARNIGLSKSRGKYILFVDSDDTLPVDAFKSLRAGFQNNPKIDIVIGSYFKNDKLVQLPNKKVNNLEIITDLILPDFIMGYLWNKLYKSIIIKNNNLRLDSSLSYAEDLVFNLDYLFHCNNGQFISENVYYYNFHENSLSTSFNEKAITIQLESQRKAIKKLIKREIKDDIIQKYINAYFRSLSGMLLHYRWKLPLPEIKFAKEEISKVSFVQLSTIVKAKLLFSRLVIFIRLTHCKILRIKL